MGRKNRTVYPGEKFDLLTVLEELSPDERGNIYCLCVCDCQSDLSKDEREIRRVLKSSLLHGRVHSCGCIRSKALMDAWKIRKKRNEYDLTSEKYGIGYTSNTGSEFYFDLDDYDLIKDYHWLENDQEYIIASVGKEKRHSNPNMPKNIRIHRLIMNVKDGQIIDHINHNRKDNRKSNLRLSNKQLNGINRPCNKNNKTGVKGVEFYKTKTMPVRYRARIMHNGKSIDLGTFDTIEEAASARMKAEIGIYGEHAYVPNTGDAGKASEKERQNEI